MYFIKQCLQESSFFPQFSMSNYYLNKKLFTYKWIDFFITLNFTPAAKN